MRKKIWPALSIVSLFGFFNFTSFMIIESKFSYLTIFMSIVLYVLIVPSIFLFLELTNLRENMMNLWGNFPVEIHKWIVFICLFWIFILIKECLLPFLKNNYGKSSE